MTAKLQLLIFSRFPARGRVKTRLIPALGAEGAAEFQRLMTEHIMLTVRQSGIPASIHYTGASRWKFQAWLGPGFSYFPQTHADLGQRMADGLARAFQHGAGKCVVIGCDCPEISPEILAEAFRRLEDHEVVLGPAEDGGYYLVGLRRPIPELFENIFWDAADVYKQTLRQCQRLNLKTAILKTLPDVDRPGDLAAAESALGQNAQPRISVIIPALNEASQIQATLKAALQAQNVEVLVADGGSTDSTPAAAHELGARVISAPRGRSLQMNAGAATATGELLLFLHADTWLPAGYDRTVRHTLAQPNVTLGAFSLAFTSRSAVFKLIAGLANIRSRWLGLPYGDQAFFVSRSRFEAAGGFPKIPILEDYALARAFRRHGRVRTVCPAVLTSARRWQDRGIWRTFILNQMVVAGYLLGVSPETLAHWRTVWLGEESKSFRQPAQPDGGRAA